MASSVSIKRRHITSDLWTGKHWRGEASQGGARIGMVFIGWRTADRSRSDEMRSGVLMQAEVGQGPVRLLFKGENGYENREQTEW